MKPFSLRYKTPPPTIEVLFANTAVGELTREESRYLFRYLPAFQRFDLAPIPGFPETGKEYRSTTLWPFFIQRIPDRRRPEIQRFIAARGLGAPQSFVC